MSNYYDDATVSGWSINGSEWNVMGSDIVKAKNHADGDGSDHAFIDQDVTTTGSPTFAAGAVTGSWTAGYFIGDGSQLTGISASGASFTYKEKINGEIYTGNLGYFVIPDELDGKEIKEVRIALLGLNSGYDVQVDVRKNGTTTTESIFTSDVPISIADTAVATNGVYQSGCDTVGSTVGTAGTTLDSLTTTIAADDVLYIYVTQVGSTSAGTDLIVEVIIS